MIKKKNQPDIYFRKQRTFALASAMQHQHPIMLILRRLHLYKHAAAPPQLIIRKKINLSYLPPESNSSLSLSPFFSLRLFYSYFFPFSRLQLFFLFLSLLYVLLSRALFLFFLSFLSPPSLS